MRPGSAPPSATGTISKTPAHRSGFVVLSDSARISFARSRRRSAEAAHRVHHAVDELPRRRTSERERSEPVADHPDYDLDCERKRRGEALRKAEGAADSDNGSRHDGASRERSNETTED